MLSIFFAWLYRLQCDIIGLIMPLFATERLLEMGRALWFLLHVLLVGGIAVGLWFLDGYLEIYRYIQPVRAPQEVARAWLAILWLLFYAILMLCWVLYRLMVREQPESYFPDIEAAWKAGVEALERNNLELKRLPLFLVLGRAEAGDDAIFAAAGLPLELRQTPPGEEPVHVYATAKAIFITCPGASVLGGLSAWLHGEGPGAMSSPEEGLDATLRPGQGGGGKNTNEIQRLISRAGGNPNNLSPADRRQLRYLERQDNPQKARSRTPDVIELETARLRYLCFLIARDRAPLCGLNGALVLLPFAGLDTAQDAALVGDACSRDLTATREALGVHCPVLAVLADMESAPGFPELVSRFAENQRRNRIGQGTPLVAQHREAPDGRNPAARMYRSLARWICQGVMRYWVLTKCQLEKAPGGMVPEGMETNIRLFMLLHEMHERQTRLADVLEKGFSTYAPPDKMLFGGCYLAATGRERPHQAFLFDVFDKLIKGDEYVYWTDEVLNEEYRLNGWINFGWLMLGLAVLAAIALGIYLMIFRSS